MKSVICAELYKLRHDRVMSADVPSRTPCPQGRTENITILPGCGCSCWLM